MIVTLVTLVLFAQDALSFSWHLKSDEKPYEKDMEPQRQLRIYKCNIFSKLLTFFKGFQKKLKATFL
jgi:hypothetical protein